MFLDNLRSQYWDARSRIKNFHTPYTLHAVFRYSELYFTLLFKRVRKSNQNKQSLALFAWLFPPLVSGGVYRPTALTRYAVSTGWDVTIVAGPEPVQPSAAGLYLLSQIPESVNIVRVQEAKFPTASWFPSLDNGFMNGIEGYFTAIRILDMSPPRIIMASGPPFHNFVAAYYVARRYKARLVLEYRDEWTQTPFDFVRRGNSDSRWEQRCLRQADQIIFTTESQRLQLLGVYPFLDGLKCAVIPNGWEPDDIPAKSSRARICNNNKIVITFTGNLGDHTPPGQFLETLEYVLNSEPSLLKRLRLRFIGEKSKRALDQIARFSHQEVLELVELIPKPEAFQAMQDADALLVINTSLFERYLPGKLYEYLASGTPVLVFGEGGEIGQIVTTLNAGVVIPDNSPEALHHTLNNLPHLCKDARNKNRDRWLADHTRKNLSGRLLKLLYDL